MPELPEVETVRRGLQPVLEGARIERVELRRGNLRFPFPEHFVDRLTGHVVVSLGRRAKYLVAELDDDTVLLMHLGMSGSFRIEADDAESNTPGVFHHPRSKAEAHDHVVFHLSNGQRIIYNDPRRFGFMTLSSRATLHEDPYLKGLGVEPVGNAFDGKTLRRLFEGKKTSLKAALLDQRLVAGLGNIYVCEALNRAKLAPERLAGKLTPKTAELLATSIRDVLGEAITAGGSSLRDHRQTNGELGYFQHSFRVYDREGETCVNSGCGGTIERKVQTGRSTFFCPRCQK
jgi:formamidopyrimidine-DNA glycosylase